MQNSNLITSSTSGLKHINCRLYLSKIAIPVRKIIGALRDPILRKWQVRNFAEGIFQRLIPKGKVVEH